MSNIFYIDGFPKAIEPIELCLFLAIAFVQLSFLDRLILTLYTKNGHPWEL